MNRWNALHWSRLGLAVQLIVLLRPPVRYFRMKFAMGDAMTMAHADPLMVNMLVVSVFTVLVVAAYAIGRYRAVPVLALLGALASVLVEVALRG